MRLRTQLAAYTESVLANTSRVPPQRKDVLDNLAAYVAENASADKPAQLVFICTHNSRRSHLAQIWATVAAAVHGLPVVSYSGGTEVTAFNPRAVAALERAGFAVANRGGDNPRYTITYAPDAPGIVCFSKTYDDDTNPTSGFAAVMTCDDADKNCPFIPGATRIAVRYEDPKVADGTPEESARYDERTRQIAAEMFYVMQQVAERVVI